MYLICRAALQDHIIEGLCKFVRELLAMCHHADKLFLQRHCESGIMFLICHVTSSDTFKVGLSPSKKIASFAAVKTF